jgi:hypothetical protein
VANFCLHCPPQAQDRGKRKKRPASASACRSSCYRPISPFPDASETETRARRNGNWLGLVRLQWSVPLCLYRVVLVKPDRQIAHPILFQSSSTDNSHCLAQAGRAGVCVAERPRCCVARLAIPETRAKHDQGGASPIHLSLTCFPENTWASPLYPGLPNSMHGSLCAFKWVGNIHWNTC